MKKLLFVTCLLLACNTVRAGDSTVNPAAKAGPVVDTKPPAAKAAAKTYTPKSRSVFTASANDHNPFWPIGWIKMENLSAADSGASVIPHAEDFSVTSILLNEPPMAVINGKEMAEGEIAAVSLNGQPVMIQLMAVQDGRVILRWQNQNLTVLLHRQEDFSKAVIDQPATAALR